MGNTNPSTRLLTELVDALNASSRIDREVNRLVPGYGSHPEEVVVRVSSLSDLLTKLR